MFKAPFEIVERPFQTSSVYDNIICVYTCQVLFIAFAADIGLPSIWGASATMRFLAGLVRGLHMAIGIHTPPPEQESLYVLVWIGLILFMAAGMALLFYLLG